MLPFFGGSFRFAAKPETTPLIDASAAYGADNQAHVCRRRRGVSTFIASLPRELSRPD